MKETQQETIRHTTATKSLYPIHQNWRSHTFQSDSIVASAEYVFCWAGIKTISFRILRPTFWVAFVYIVFLFSLARQLWLKVKKSSTWIEINANVWKKETETDRGSSNIKFISTDTHVGKISVQNWIHFFRSLSGSRVNECKEKKSTTPVIESGQISIYYDGLCFTLNHFAFIFLCSFILVCFLSDLSMAVSKQKDFENDGLLFQTTTTNKQNTFDWKASDQTKIEPNFKWHFIFQPLGPTFKK